VKDRNVQNKNEYRNFIGCGGMRLLDVIERELMIRPGSKIIDIGCGFGDSSVYLANKYEDLSVVSIDKWFDQEAVINGGHGRIIPIKDDASDALKKLEKDHFDYAICMNSYFLMHDASFNLNQIMKHLRPGGKLCIASECFRLEVHSKRIVDLLDVELGWNPWKDCFSKYHSPVWWMREFSSLLEGGYRIETCGELDIGVDLFDAFIDNMEQSVGPCVKKSGAVMPRKNFMQLRNELKNEDNVLTMMMASIIRTT